MRSVLPCVATLVACGGGGAPSTTVGNRTGGGDAVRVDPGAALGVIALPAARLRSVDAPFWVAMSPDAAAVVPTPAAEALAAGVEYAAISAAGGAPVRLTAGPRTTIGYGCDQTDLDVVPLVGAPVAPSLLWVLPAPVPAGWSPAALPLVGEPARKDLRRWRAGAVEVELARTDATHAELRVGVDGRIVHHAAVEAYYMEGAGEIDVDLTEGARPGIPYPEAVFTIAPAGPYVVFLDTSGYEGVSFTMMLVTADGGQTIDGAGMNAYYCAF